MERKEALIAAIVENIPKGLASDGRHHPYYLLNYENPVIDGLYRDFRKKRGLLDYLPVSDQERTEFELLLFKPVVLARLEELISSPKLEMKNQKESE